MPSGYTLYPHAQMKIEDERTGRLDYTYETALSADGCIKRIGNKADGKISEYETEIKDGILYISFGDPYQDQAGLSVGRPMKYAVRFESMADKTIIRVRYVWEINVMNTPYIMKEDIDAFFISLFDGKVSESGNKVWTDSTEEFVQSDPLGIHGSKGFWIVCAVFTILWLVLAISMYIRM